MKKRVVSITLDSFKFPLLILSVFACIAVWSWKRTDNVFLLFNFIYIGISVATGVFLWIVLTGKYKQWGRRFAQFMIGLYMLAVLGAIKGENMQIEGFFFYLFAGFFGGATIHYLVAKIGGPLLFGRGWCGWACWTAMVLDLLPWYKPVCSRLKFAGLFRYVHFVFSFIVVFLLVYVINYRYGNPFISGVSKTMELHWLLVGNVFYYVLALILAVILKDNRAFCKYGCPIPVLQKITSRFSIVKMNIDMDLCINCGLCEKQCPMNIQLLEYARKGKRVLSTECILCNTCVDNCPADAVTMRLGLDAGIHEHISFSAADTQ